MHALIKILYRLYFFDMCKCISNCPVFDSHNVCKGFLCVLRKYRTRVN